MRPIRLSIALLVSCSLEVQAASSLDAIASLPPCAITCLTTAISNSSCHLTDISCVCADTVLIATMEPCVLVSCTIKESLVTKNMTSITCGIPIRNKSSQTRLPNIVLSVATAAVSLVRLGHNAYFSPMGWGFDDYTLLAVLIAGAPSVVIIDRMSIPSGLGRDVWTVSFSEIAVFVRSIYALEALYCLQIALVKVTLLFFLLRIFPRQTIRQLIRYTLIFNVIYGVVFTIIAIFPCRPISFYWTNWSRETKGWCVNIHALVWAHATISIVLDVWMLAIPLFEVLRLQLSWGKRISVALMFFVGTFVTIVSLIRLRFLVVFAKGNNPTWDQANIVHWSNIEINVGILCTCLPTIRVMLTQAFPKILYSTRGSGQGSSRKGSTHKLQRLDDGPDAEGNL